MGSKVKQILWLAVLLVSGLATYSHADGRFIVRASAVQIDGIAARHNLLILGVLDDQGQVYLAASTGPKTALEMEAEMDADPEILGCEVDAAIAVPEAARLNQSTAAILDGLGAPAPMDFFGTQVLAKYIFQPAAGLLRLAEVQNRLRVTGAGAVVAIIDTGVDPNHPALQASLLPGYDFVHDWAGTASEFSDLPDAAAAALNQSTAAILDKTQMVLVNQSTAAILDQSTAAILDTTQLPAAFGHGTMVAGVVHLTAPNAQILPLKAFTADGTGMLSTILRAIYYAVDNNADVINMSFSLPEASPELTRALNYAAKRHVVAVASVGNTGQEDVSYPAALSTVIGVGSTSNNDVRSTFSSYGLMVSLGAPGEGIVTTYPANTYASASGTSFSAPFVAGTAALIRQVTSDFELAEVADALSHAKSVPQMGKGRLDAYSAVRSAY